jgi:hypothetical protein
MSYNAREAREAATTRTAIFGEIRILEAGIETAVGNGSLEATIGPVSSVATGLSNSAVAFAAWSDPANNTTDAHDVARYQMNEVIGHFTRLGFQVSRAQHESEDKFNWHITW